MIYPLLGPGSRVAQLRMTCSEAYPQQRLVLQVIPRLVYVLLCELSRSKFFYLPSMTYSTGNISQTSA